MKVRLELESITLDEANKKRWQLYFVLAVEHPDDDTKMLITVLPDPPIKLTPDSKNHVDFVGEGNGAEGFSLLHRTLPEGKDNLNVRFYLMHSRKNARKVGEVLKELKSEFGTDAGKILTKVVSTGTAFPWLEVAKLGFDLIGHVLRNLPDRELGFVSMYEIFGAEFEKEVEVDRRKQLSSGKGHIVYTWSVG